MLVALQEEKWNLIASNLEAKKAVTKVKLQIAFGKENEPRQNPQMLFAAPPPPSNLLHRVKVRSPY